MLLKKLKPKFTLFNKRKLKNINIPSDFFNEVHSEPTTPLPTKIEKKETPIKKEKASEFKSVESAATYRAYLDSIAGKPKSKERKRFEKDFSTLIIKLGQPVESEAKKQILLATEVKSGDNGFHVLIKRAIKEYLKKLDKGTAKQKKHAKGLKKLLQFGKKGASIDQGIEKVAAKLSTNFAEAGFQIGLIKKKEKNGQKPDLLILGKGRIGLIPDSPEAKTHKEKFSIDYFKKTLTPTTATGTVKKLLKKQEEIKHGGKVIRPALPAYSGKFRPGLPPVWEYTDAKGKTQQIATSDHEQVKKLAKAKTKIKMKAPAVSPIFVDKNSDRAYMISNHFTKEKYRSERMHLERKYEVTKGKLKITLKSQRERLSKEIGNNLYWDALRILLKGKVVNQRTMRRVYHKLTEIAQILKEEDAYRGSVPRGEYKLNSATKNIFAARMLKLIYERNILSKVSPAAKKEITKILQSDIVDIRGAGRSTGRSTSRRSTPPRPRRRNPRYNDEPIHPDAGRTPGIDPDDEPIDPRLYSRRGRTDRYDHDDPDSDFTKKYNKQNRQKKPKNDDNLLDDRDDYPDDGVLGDDDRPRSPRSKTKRRPSSRREKMKSPTYYAFPSESWFYNKGPKGVWAKIFQHGAMFYAVKINNSDSRELVEGSAALKKKHAEKIKRLKNRYRSSSSPSSAPDNDTDSSDGTWA